LSHGNSRAEFKPLFWEIEIGENMLTLGQHICHGNT
jgi:hypothetical protein